MTDLPCACTALRKASRAISRVFDEALAETGLTTTQFAVLRYVVRLEDAPLSRLAGALVMDRTSLYRTLQPMIRAGWLTVEPSPKGRSKIARLTNVGRERLAAATPTWEAAQTRFVDRFGAESWAAINAALDEVVRASAESVT
jgi:DNA-binding MarR family transcriptional regulator